MMRTPGKRVVRASPRTPERGTPRGGAVLSTPTTPVREWALRFRAGDGAGEGAGAGAVAGAEAGTGEGGGGRGTRRESGVGGGRRSGPAIVPQSAERWDEAVEGEGVGAGGAGAGAGAGAGEAGVGGEGVEAGEGSDGAGAGEGAGGAEGGAAISISSRSSSSEESTAPQRGRGGGRGGRGRGRPSGEGATKRGREQGRPSGEGVTKRGRGRPRKEPRDPGIEQAEGVRETVVGVGKFCLYPNGNPTLDTTFRVDYPKLPGMGGATVTFHQEVEVQLLLEHENLSEEVRTMIRHRLLEVKTELGSLQELSDKF